MFLEGVFIMDDKERLKRLEDSVSELKYQIVAQQSYLDMQSVPEWAKEAVSIAESNGLMPSPIGGSFDFYRLLAYLYKRVF
jgi:hypothetical protein